MYNQVQQEQTVATVQQQAIVQEIPQLPLVEWIQEPIVETIEVISQEEIEEQIGDILVPQEQRSDDPKYELHVDQQQPSSR